MADHDRNAFNKRALLVAPAADPDAWKPFHYALKDLPHQKKWANSVAFAKERSNAMLNPTVDTPVMYVDGPTLVAAGATDADMRALHKLSPDEMNALRLEATTIKRTNQLTVDAAAKQRVAASTLDLVSEVLTPSGLAEIEPVRPLIVGFLARGQLADLNGAPGTGKTMAAVGMGAALASGTRWCGHAVPERAAVLYVAAEGATGIRPRLFGWCEKNGVAPDSIEDTFLIAPRAVQMGDDDHMRQVRDLVKQRNVALVVFDTRARCTVGVEENSATEHGRVIANADEISQQTGAAVLVVHHTAAGSDRARGTTAWDGAVWSSLLLTRGGGKKKSRKVSITAMKHKEWSDGHTHEFQLTDHTVSEALMPDVTAAQRSTLVMTGVDPATFHDDELSTTETHAEILAMIAELGGGEGLSRADIVKFAAERGLGGKTKIYKALTALTDKGKQLVKVPGAQRLAARELIEGMPDIKDGVTVVGSPIYTAAVDNIIADLCARHAEGRITMETAKTDAHKLVGGHVVPYAEAWTRWVFAERPTDPDQVPPLTAGDAP